MLLWNRVVPNGPRTGLEAGVVNSVLRVLDERAAKRQTLLDTRIAGDTLRWAIVDDPVGALLGVATQAAMSADTVHYTPALLAGFAQMCLHACTALSSPKLARGNGHRCGHCRLETVDRSVRLRIMVPSEAVYRKDEVLGWWRSPGYLCQSLISSWFQKGLR